MRKRDLFAEARATFRELKPTRMGGVALTSDGKSVVIAGYDESISLVLNAQADLLRVIAMCQIAIERQNEVIPGKN